jgi:probable HAF family extracellular repeat protein
MKLSIGPVMLVIALPGFATLTQAQTVIAPPHYTVINLGSLGGSASNGYGGVTNSGWVSGDSYLGGNPSDQSEHAFVWRSGVMTDLGTVGGANSSAPFPVKDERGLVVGQSQGSQIDPLKENWGVAYVCNTSDGHCTGWQNQQFGFVWRKGVMTPLPTLGGNNSSAFGVNNRGQVVGFAETDANDPTCPTSPTNQPDRWQQPVINALVYGPRGDVQQQLLPLKGDDFSAAVGINDNGDVVGLSGRCGTPDSFALGVHAVLWRNGSVFNLPGLGGGMNNAAIAINNAGQIAGISDPPGDATTYAVLWQRNAGARSGQGGYAIISLGTLPGDASSVSADINARGQVVGSSCDANFNCRAFLWEKGPGMIDLNSLIPSAVSDRRRGHQ